MIVERNINGVSFGIHTRKPNGLLCDPFIADIINNDIDSFIDYLYCSGGGKYTPMVATWELTNTCNFSCWFCYIHTPGCQNHLYYSIQKMKAYIDAFVDRGLLLVYLTGGEVFTIPWFKDLYIYLKEKGVLVCILTNLSLLDTDLVELFKIYPPMRITASIYSLDERRFSDITCSDRKIMHTVLDNILLLKQNGINVTCQTPINKMTIEEYLDISKWCYDHNIKHSASDEMRDTYTGISRKEYEVPHEEFVKLKNRTQRANIIYSSPKDFTPCYGVKKHFDCKAGRYYYVIGTDMMIRPCFDLYGDKRFEFSAKDNVNEALDAMTETIQDYKKKSIDGCRGCCFVTLCNECIVTQKPHEGRDLETYMKEKCKRRITQFASSYSNENH